MYHSSSRLIVVVNLKLIEVRPVGLFAINVTPFSWTVYDLRFSLI